LAAVVTAIATFLGPIAKTLAEEYTLTLHKKPEIDSLNFKQLFSKPQETVSNLL